MTNKERYSWDFIDEYFIIRDNKTGKEYYQTEIYYLLNEQHERIEDYNVALKRLQDLADKKIKENEQLKQRISELELLNDGLNYALKNIKKIDVKIDVGDVE